MEKWAWHILVIKITSCQIFGEFYPFGRNTTYNIPAAKRVRSTGFPWKLFKHSVQGPSFPFEFLGINTTYYKYISQVGMFGQKTFHPSRGYIQGNLGYFLLTLKYPFPIYMMETIQTPA